MAVTAKQPTGGAYETLRSEILHGDLMPGDRLRVAELNEKYKLGLTPIREALVRLSSEGLVANESHRGARVPETTLAELSDLMRTRREIEEICLRHSIANGDEGWEADILSAMHLLSRASLPKTPEDRETAAEWETRHRRFHYLLVSACGSPWLLTIWNMLVDHSERYRKLRLLLHRQSDADVRNLNAEHEQIMQHVLDRDADAAVALMDQHLASTEAAVARLLRLKDEQD